MSERHSEKVSDGIQSTRTLPQTLLASPASEPLLSALHSVAKSIETISTELPGYDSIERVKLSVLELKQVVLKGICNCTRQVEELEEELQLLSIRTLSSILENFIVILSKMKERSSMLDSSSTVADEVEQCSCREILKELRFGFVYPMVMKIILVGSEEFQFESTTELENLQEASKKLSHALLYPLRQLKEISALNLGSSTASNHVLNGISEIICEEASFQMAKCHGQKSKLKELSSNDLEESLEDQVLTAGSYVSFISSMTRLIKESSPTLKPINRWRTFSTLDSSNPSTSTSLIRPQEREPRLEQTLEACLSTSISNSDPNSNSKVPVEGERVLEAREEGRELLKLALAGVWAARGNWGGVF